MATPQNIIEILISIFGEMPNGLEFLYYITAFLLLIFVFHLIEHLFETFFSKFYH